MSINGKKSAYILENTHLTLVKRKLYPYFEGHSPGKMYRTHFKVGVSISIKSAKENLGLQRTSRENKEGWMALTC